jgi:MinD superfamily P-loop ATPase
MKQLVMLSGKGGTGKTVVSAAFIDLANRNGNRRAIAVDADVDAANLELLVGGRRLEEHEFIGGMVAEIDFRRCAGCGDCQDFCRFEAIRPATRGWGFEVDALACEGCATCFHQCPYEAIDLVPRVAGSWYRSETRGGAPFFHARLRAAQENSGKLVTLIRREARSTALRDGHLLTIVDGPPGIACPAIAASTGADLALIVAEPTVSGLHDLRRILEMTAHFHLKRVVCVNKHDLHPDGAAAIKAECQGLDVEVLQSVPFDEAVSQATTSGRPVTDLHPSSAAARALERLWEQVRDLLTGGAGRRELPSISAASKVAAPRGE